MPVAAELRPEDTWALVVGVESYPLRPGLNLDGPFCDACDFAGWLCKRGVPGDHISILGSPLEKNKSLCADLQRNGAECYIEGVLTQQVVDESLKRFRTKRGILIVFWSGHGIMTRGGVRRPLLGNYSETDKYTLNVDSLRQHLHSAPYAYPAEQVLIFDVCGTRFDELWQRHDVPDTQFPAGPEAPRCRQFILFASEDGQAAENLTQKRTGLYYRELRAILETQQAWLPNMEEVHGLLKVHFAGLSDQGLATQTPIRYYWHAPSGEQEVIDLVKTNAKREAVTVNLVTDFFSPETEDEVLAALDLYERRITTTEQFPAHDILRWLQEGQRRHESGSAPLRDYFLIAKNEMGVCGFTLVHYYSSERIAFIAYLVSDKEKAGSFPASGVAAKLFAKVADLMAADKHMSNCECLLLEVESPTEVEDPRDAPSDDERIRRARERRKRLGRLSLFYTVAQLRRFSLQALDFDYRRPPLTEPRDGVCDPGTSMLLMYASKTPASSLPRDEVDRFLRFIYLSLYPDNFSPIEEENVAYQKLLLQRYRELKTKIPERVQMLNFSQVKHPSERAASHSVNTSIEAGASVAIRGGWRAPVDFVIITPLEDERDAVLSKLGAYQKVPPTEHDIRFYFCANIPTVFPDGKTGSYSVVVAKPLNMGRVEATNVTKDAIHRWRPRYVLLVGIAGGMKRAGVKLGDVIVADQIADYELQKLTRRRASVRWQVHRVDPGLLGAAQNLIGHGWRDLISVGRPDAGAPERRIGPICTGDKVIANGLIDHYQGVWDKLVGVEMEAGGVASAAFQAAQSVGFFMVRGISDLADEDKDSSQVGIWRSYACDVAASYAVALLKNGPVAIKRLPK